MPRLVLWNSKCVMLKVVAKANRNVPWWLENGTEICSACGHTYVYETGFRCVACDAALCGMCVEHTQVEVFCGTCPDDSAES